MSQQFSLGADNAIALRPWISNADSFLQIVPTASGEVPVLVPDPRVKPTPLAERAWVTCLWSGSAGYAIDEWVARAERDAGAKSRWYLKGGLKAVAGLSTRLSWWLGPWRGAVQVGSWPFSTTLRETLRDTDLIAVLESVIDCYPDRPIALRHVFEDNSPALLEALARRGFQRLPARVVYTLDASQAIKPKASHLKRDLALLARSDLTIVPDAEFTPQDLERALDLYQIIYRQRHSLRNPDYSIEFLQWAQRRGLIELLGLRSSTGQLCAFAARHNQGTTTSVPMLGYDLEADRRDGLYRQLVALLIREAGVRRQTFDFSSGAGDFKRKRG
ncbi:MAG: GNAT family N-acetyltransferase, partial [Betaproteobacteria bacterium]|nr:GNAT family N-acetyltransferase [Betaproteobacteria bacterium]